VWESWKSRLAVQRRSGAEERAGVDGALATPLVGVGGYAVQLRDGPDGPLRMGCSAQLAAHHCFAARRSSRTLGRNGATRGLVYNLVMKRDAAELLREALELPPEARAALAGSLIDSLDSEVDDGIEAAWDAEIARRIRELDEGKAKLVPWAEVRRRLTRQ
jgi:putative addiction module component (TIGR02574 family)